MKTYGGVDVQIHSFFTSALFEGELSASLPGSFALQETATDTLWIGYGTTKRTLLGMYQKQTKLKFVTQQPYLLF
jgi:hypothetical protein